MLRLSSVDLRNQTRDARAEWAREMGRSAWLNGTFPCLWSYHTVKDWWAP